MFFHADALELVGKVLFFFLFCDKESRGEDFTHGAGFGDDGDMLLSCDDLPGIRADEMLASGCIVA